MSVIPKTQHDTIAWTWHPYNPRDEFELSDCTRAVLYGTGLRIEQMITPCIEVIHLNNDEMVGLYELLQRELGRA